MVRCGVSVCVCYLLPRHRSLLGGARLLKTISLNFTPAQGEINFSYKNTNRARATSSSMCHSVASAHLPHERFMFIWGQIEIKIDRAFVNTPSALIEGCRN